MFIYIYIYGTFSVVVLPDFVYFQDGISLYIIYIYGNISLNSGISWGLAAPRPPHGFPRVLRHGEPKKHFFEKLFLMIFRLISRPYYSVYSCAIINGIWSAVILEKCWKIGFMDPPQNIMQTL